MKKPLVSIILTFIFFQFPSFIFSQQKYCISDIYILNDGITKKGIILRELPFEIGDSIDIHNIDNLLLLAKENLLNLSLFNFVYCNYEYVEGCENGIVISIKTEERWYIWPMINVVLEDRNLSSWIDKGEMRRVTLDAGLRAYNLWGLNHTLTGSIKTGYQRGFRFEYNNIYLDKKMKLLLNLGAYREYSRTENVRIEDNTPYYYKSDDFIVDKNLFNISLTYRPKIRISHSLKVKYDQTDIAKSILEENPDYWGGTDTLRRGISICYKYNSDQRDNNQYPLQGYLISCGLSCYTAFDDNFRYGQLSTTLQYCYPICKRWFLSTTLSAALSAKNKNAYVFDRAIGYEMASIRGMELYVADGQHYVVLNPTIKYNIIPTKVVVLDWLSFLKKFYKIHFALYGKAFFDGGYSYNQYKTDHNGLSNKLLYSTGIGLDFVTYYDINISIEYSFNMLNKGGFFFSFKGPLI